MLVEEDEPGEPFTYSSSTYTAPTSPGANPDLLPEAQTYLTIEPSAAAQSSDLMAFSNPRFRRCFSIEDNGPLFAVIRGFTEALHGQFTVGPLLPVFIPSEETVKSVAYSLTMHLKARSFTGSQTVYMAIMGASSIEEVLVLRAWATSPLSAQVRADMVSKLESGLARFARSGG